MKNILKKVLFPLFNSSNHDFLMKKWWFRVLIIFYIMSIIYVLGLFWVNISNSLWGRCYNSLMFFSPGGKEFLSQFYFCREQLRENLMLAVFLVSVLTASVHYIIQIVFFKIVINFIVLGGKKKPRSKAEQEKFEKICEMVRPLSDAELEESRKKWAGMSEVEREKVEKQLEAKGIHLKHKI